MTKPRNTFHFFSKTQPNSILLTILDDIHVTVHGTPSLFLQLIGADKLHPNNNPLITSIVTNPYPSSPTNTLSHTHQPNRIPAITTNLYPNINHNAFHSHRKQLLIPTTTTILLNNLTLTLGMERDLTKINLGNKTQR